MSYLSFFVIGIPTEVSVYIKISSENDFQSLLYLFKIFQNTMIEKSSALTKHRVAQSFGYMPLSF